VFGHKRRAEQKAPQQPTPSERDRAALRAAIVNLIALAQGQDSTDPDWPLMLKPGERLFSTLTGGGLFEPRREPGHWSGRSAGVSVPTGVAGIRVRVGRSAGTFVQGAETPTVIDTGNASITSQRVVFQGEKYTREWDYSKLIGIVHYSDRPATAIQVSNRQKTSGIVYPGPSPEPIRLALTVAVAVFRGEADETIEELQGELARLDSAGPVQPTQGDRDGPTPPPAQKQTSTPSTQSTPQAAHKPPPMWGPDPSGRHEFRYWDGTTWTDWVSDKGTQNRDPLLNNPNSP
jgi:hypothetical protein